jgi:hypothetical protein
MEADIPLDTPRLQSWDEDDFFDGRAAPAVQRYQARLDEGLRSRRRGDFPQAAT